MEETGNVGSPATAGGSLRSRRRRWGSARASLDGLRIFGAPHRRKRVAPPPGAPPGQLEVSETAAETEIHAITYGADGADERIVESLDELSGLAQPGERIAWIDVRGLGNRGALERIGEVFAVHPLALADVSHVPQRPKAEMHDGLLLIVTQMARVNEDREVAIEQLSLILGPRWVLTFQESAGDVLDPVRERVRSGASRIRQMGPDFLAYALVDAVIDGYFPVIEAIGEILEDLEELVMGDPDSGALARLHAARRTLLHLHRVQWRQRDAIATMMRDETLPFSESVRLYLRDAHDHAFQAVDAIETYRDMAVGLMDVYLSSASHRMNEVMKTLTVMASLFIPLTFVAGVYGMNFERMPELHWRWGYPAIWAAMLAIAGVLLAWFRRRGWLGARPPG